MDEDQENMFDKLMAQQKEEDDLMKFYEGKKDGLLSPIDKT